MGFLSKIFGLSKDSHAQSECVTSVGASAEMRTYYVDIRQKTSGLLSAAPLDSIDGYVSPSGGFLNYARFQVICINPSTKRKNKRIYEVRTKEEACECAQNDGFIGPYEISAIPFSPPTERQLAFAKTLEAVLPDGACGVDVSAIISRITDNDEKPVPLKLVHQAHIRGLKFSRYHGREAIMSIAKGNLSVTEYAEFVLSI